MLNNYKQLTGRYLRANKKRTILTIIGIILSVALISSIGLFFKGIQLAQIDEAKNNYGSYHIIYNNVDKDLLSKIQNNPKVARSGLLVTGEEIEAQKGVKLRELIATDKGLELLPYKIKEGKFPEKEKDIAIEKWALKSIDKNAKVGNKITIAGKEYTLTGILEDSIKSQMDNKGVLLSINNNIDINKNKEKAMLAVEVSSKTNLRTAVRELKELGSKEDVQINSMLISLQGGAEKDSGIMGLYTTIGIIIGIVLISTIAVIYNSFHISVVDRIKQFGLLRAVGTTPKQIRKIVFREATILALIGIPIGLLCGVIAIYGISFTFKLIGGDSVQFIKPSVSPDILGISASVGVVAIYISAFLPAHFAGKISPLVAISSRNSINKEKIKRRKSFIFNKLMGFESSLAYKNIKRNKKRYRITVFSIIISVLLFITFKSFMDMSLKITSEVNESQDIHFMVYKNRNIEDGKYGIEDKFIKDLSNLKSIDKSYNVYRNIDFASVIEKTAEIPEVKEIEGMYKDIKYEGKDRTFMNSSLAIYDNNSLEASKKYLAAGNIDIDKLNSENGVIVINKNRMYIEKKKKSYHGAAANLKVGDEIFLKSGKNGETPEVFGQGKVKKVKVMAVLESDPFDFRGPQNGLKLITTEKVAKELVDKERARDIEPVNVSMKLKDVKNEEAVQGEIEEIIKQDGSLKLINSIDDSRKMKSSMLMVQILMYGFVIVISLIGSVNIINTLTTNIILRKREFAALKSIGLTQKGLRKMIVLEGLFYGIFGALYGSILGAGVSYLMFSGMSGAREFAWTIPWNAIIIAVVCSLAIGYLSVLSPLARIKKDNLIEAIKDEH